MLSISSGHSAEYLTGQVAQGRENYYLDATTAGEPPGRWSGTGAEALGLVGEVGNDVMTAIYSEFRDPRDPKFADPATRDQAATLGRAPGRFKSEEELVAERLAAEPGALPERVREIELEVRKKTRQPVMFVDATFSPVKSFTVMHTALQRAELDAQRAGDDVRAGMWAAMRAEVEAALWAGNQAMLSELSARAGYARTGRHGAGAGRWTDAHDWTVASFHQSDSRDHDPQQHIHNAILNRVVCPDGQVRALDSRAIHAWKQAAGAIGERVMEEELSRRLGVRWVMRADGQAREIEGIDQPVMDLFSERSAHINRTLAGRVTEFERAHGRAPNALELSRMRQQAALGTRRAKTSAGETAADRLDRWDAELRAEVAGGLVAVAEQVRDQAQQPARPAAATFSPA
ncbi:TrwC relaxase, partial [Jiangella aurantiaca]